MITLQLHILHEIERLCNKGRLHIRPYIGKWKLTEPNVTIELRQTIGWRIDIGSLNGIIKSEYPHYHVLEDILDDSDPQYTLYRYVLVPREYKDLRGF